uniref:Non-homologous end-joining factor 1 n=1 Tax=Salvator merianae TaxID=96440 RepID=A0A8D0BXB5_SALMN
MESTEDPGNVLLLQPWASVCFAESSKLMAKAWFGDTGYALLLSDLSSLWYERADSELIQQRSKELNKRLTGHASSFLNHLRDLMCPLLEGQQDSSTSFSCQLSPSMLILHVKSELLGLPFYWDFRCSAAPVEMMSRHLVRPLMSMSLLLQGQVQKLATLLLQKDAEIEDYRESGAALSRERLQTEPFKEESFLQTFEDERQETLGALKMPLPRTLSQRLSMSQQKRKRENARQQLNNLCKSQWCRPPSLRKLACPSPRAKGKRPKGCSAETGDPFTETEMLLLS